MNSVPSVHHIGVQTSDLDNCLKWYVEFFAVEQKWCLDRFSELTHSRLPGIRRLIEVTAGSLRFHLFDRAHTTGAPADGLSYQFQHICLQVQTPDDLVTIRDRWIRLFESGSFAFARPDYPTDIVVDSDGVQSLYVFDVNGLEYEYSYIPDGPR